MSPVNPADAGDLASLARRVRAAPALLGRTTLVVVDGPAGAGKTTFAAGLCDALDGAPAVHLDDLYDGWTLDGVTERLRARVLDPIAAGRPATFDAYDWASGQFGIPTTVPAARYLVVEGCGASARSLDPVVSLRVWVRAPAELCAQRWADRGGAEMARHQPAWATAEAAVFAREDTAARADVLVDGVTGQIAPAR